ncbi:efflux RND transporter permease subunit [Shigella flexneri]
MGVALSDINQTISTAFGSSYVNDFLDEGRVKKVYVQQARRWYACRITSTNGICATPLARWHRFLPTRIY